MALVLAAVARMLLAVMAEHLAVMAAMAAAGRRITYLVHPLDMQAVAAVVAMMEVLGVRLATAVGLVVPVPHQQTDLMGQQILVAAVVAQAEKEGQEERRMAATAARASLSFGM
jgi:hypothetical protein